MRRDLDNGPDDEQPEPVTFEEVPGIDVVDGELLPRTRSARTRRPSVR